MPRREVNTEAPFISIEEDARMLGMVVKHEGMSKREAEELADIINSYGLDAIETPLPGKIIKRYLREDRRNGRDRPRQSAERFYTLEDSPHGVSVTQGSKTLLIENRQQWALYAIMSELDKKPIKDTAEKKRKEQESEDRAEIQLLKQWFEETTGKPFSAFLDRVEKRNKNSFGIN